MTVSPKLSRPIFPIRETFAPSTFIARPVFATAPPVLNAAAPTCTSLPGFKRSPIALTFGPLNTGLMSRQIWPATITFFFIFFSLYVSYPLTLPVFEQFFRRDPRFCHDRGFAVRKLREAVILYVGVSYADHITDLIPEIIRIQAVGSRR